MQKRPIILRSLLIVANPYQDQGTACDSQRGKVQVCGLAYFQVLGLSTGHKSQPLNNPDCRGHCFLLPTITVTVKDPLDILGDPVADHTPVLFRFVDTSCHCTTHSQKPGRCALPPYKNCSLGFQAKTGFARNVRVLKPDSSIVGIPSMRGLFFLRLEKKSQE